MSELRAGATLHGTDGELGTVDAIVIDPTSGAVTHVVARHDRLGRRVLVPIGSVTSSSPEQIDVALDAAALERCEPFDEPAFNIPGDEAAGFGYDPGIYYYEPFATPLDGWVLAEHERIPKGEITIRRGDEVVASDGSHVGHVDELLVDPSDHHITHVVLRKGHILRRDDDVVVPIAGATFAEGQVQLGLDVSAVEALEHIPVHRHGHVHE